MKTLPSPEQIVHRTIRLIPRAMRESLSFPVPILWGLFVALGIGGLMVLLPNHAFIRVVLSSDAFTVGEKLTIVWKSFGAFETNFTLFSQVSIIVVSVLTGLHVPLLAQYIKKQVAIRKAAGAGTLGMVIGILGIGCSSCGSVLLSTFFGVGTATSILHLLPFGGEELSIISIGILLCSLWYIARKIDSPSVCKL